MWAGTSVYQAGPWPVAVQFAAGAVQAAVDAVLNPLPRGETAPPATYGITAGEGRGGPVYEMLYGGARVVRTRELDHLTAALASHLAAYAAWTGTSTIYEGPAVVAGGRVVLLPPSCRDLLAALERRLAAMAVAVVPGPWVELDLGPGVGLLAADPDGRDGGGGPPGLPLGAVVIGSGGGDGQPLDGPITAGFLLRHLGPLVQLPSGAAANAWVDTVVAIVRDGAVRSLPAVGAEPLLAALRRW